MYKRLINILPKTSTPITPLLLDTYPNAALALSLRKVRNSYTGPAIRVRRSTDNAEQDIYFDSNGDLDLTAIENFAGGYNMFVSTETLSSFGWSFTQLNTTGTPPFNNVEIAPDGTLTGDKIIENTTTNLHSIVNISAPLTLNPFAFTPGDYNISFYLKKGERTEARFRTTMSGCITCNLTCDINLNDGSISNNTFPNTPIVTSEPNGWYRFSVTVNRNQNANVVASSRILLLNGGNETYLGDGVSGFYFWGKQLTRGSSLKPYSAVTGSAVSAYIQKIYDQSGNNRDATITSGTATIKTQGLLYDVFFSGLTGDNVGTSSGPVNKSVIRNVGDITAAVFNITGLTSTQQYFQSAVVRRVRNQTNLSILGAGGVTTLRWNSSGSSNSIVSVMNPTLTHSADTSLGRFLFTTSRDSSNTINVWKNGSILTPGTATNVGSNIGNLTILNSLFQELIYWENTQDSNRVGIQNNVNNYWNIY